MKSLAEVGAKLKKPAPAAAVDDDEDGDSYESAAIGEFIAAVKSGNTKDAEALFRAAVRSCK